MLHSMASTSHWLPGRRLSAISIILVGLIGIAVSYTLPKEHEPDTKEGFFAPLVFPPDEGKFGAPGFLTPLNSSHLNSRKLSQIPDGQIKPSDVPDPPANSKNAPLSNSSDGQNSMNSTKDAVIAKETGNVLEDSKVVEDVKGSSQDYSRSQDSSSGKKISEQDAPLKGNMFTNVTKEGGKEQEVMKLQNLTNVSENTADTVESFVSSSVTETAQKMSTRLKANLADSHWKHDHLSGKGGPVPFTQSPEVAIMLAAVFVAVALVGYFGLVCWRRTLEEKYGNRELLVNEDEVNDMGDYKSYEL